MKKLLAILLTSFLGVFLVAGSTVAAPITLDLATIDQFTQLDSSFTVIHTSIFKSSGTGLPYTAFTTIFDSDNPGYQFVEVGILRLDWDWTGFDTFMISSFNDNESTWGFEFFVKDASGNSASSGINSIPIDTWKQLTVDLRSLDVANIDTLSLRVSAIIPVSGHDYTAEYRLVPIPEPATMLLFGTGLIGIAGLGRKKIFKKK